MPFLPLDQPDARAAIGRAAARRHAPDHGRIAGRAAPPGSPRPRRVFNSLMVFGAGRVAATITTRSIWCRSANTCRCRPCSRPSACSSWPHARRLRRRRRRRARCSHVPGLPPLGPLICYEAIFPRRDRAGGRAAGPAPQRHQRWLVRRHHRAPPALPSGARARRRGGAAAHSRRQQRHFGSRRRLRPHPGASSISNVRGSIDMPLPVRWRLRSMPGGRLAVSWSCGLSGPRCSSGACADSHRGNEFQSESIPTSVNGT